MNPETQSRSAMQHSRGFTLVELLVVIAIMAILMSAGAVGLSSIGGKGVTSGLATAESLFEEARTVAIARNLRTCVLVAKTLTNNPAEDLRRIVVAYEEVDPITGAAKAPASLTPNWVLSSRGILLPDQTFYSAKLSNKDGISKTKVTAIDTITSSRIKDVKAAYAGEYYIYQFNAQGYAADPAPPNAGSTFNGTSSFVIASGARNTSKPSTNAKPRLTASSKGDVSGFIIWKNGATSIFRNPDQAGTAYNSMKAGSEF